VSTASGDAPGGVKGQLSGLAAFLALCCYIIVLAWAPFPLGSAVSWGAGLLAALVGLCWMVWLASGNGIADRRSIGVLALWGPLLLGGLAIGWACVQIWPGVPASWIHPLWAIASSQLGTPLAGTISINPWKTQSEILKLCTAAAAFWLSFCLAREERRAFLLLDAVVVLGVLYALYGFVLSLLNVSQGSLIYEVTVHASETSGPFMLHNSFATYTGLALMAGLARLLHLGGESIASGLGTRRLLLRSVDFLSHRGLPLFLAVLVLFGAVVASRSRAGVLATILGCVSILMLALLAGRGRARLWVGLGMIAALGSLFAAILVSADALGSGYAQLLNEGITDDVRLALWAAAQRMIADAPLLGLGLGTFSDAYPLYASKTLPFVMDKAHCDYLELIAGLGIPAAAAWLVALGWLWFLCLRGALTRRRNRLFALAAAGACGVVAIHSAVDFSLQIPAVMLSFATLLGIGVAQSARSRKEA
jgi:O-antigen ligase